MDVQVGFCQMESKRHQKSFTRKYPLWPLQRGGNCPALIPAHTDLGQDICLAEKADDTCNHARETCPNEADF